MAHPYQGWSLNDRDPQFIRSLFPLWDWLYTYYFQVQSEGWQHVPDQPVLFVGSHNGGLAAPDMHMAMYDWFRRVGCDRPTYGLMHPKAWDVFPELAELAARAGAVRAHPKMAIAALQRQASVLVYPGGAQDAFRPHDQRDRIHFAGRTGFIKLAMRENVPIVPIISWGAHDTLYIVDDCYEQAKQLHQWGIPWFKGIDPEVFPIYFGLPWGLAIGPLPNLPLPSQIHLRVGKPIYFERSGRNAVKDQDYIQTCYNSVASQMQQDLDELVALYQH